MTATPTEQELAALTEDELFLRLGRTQVGTSAVPQSAATLAARGRALFREVQARLQPHLCGPGSTTTVDNLTYASLVAIINNEVAGTATFHLGSGGALLVAMLILRHGHARFCAGYARPATAAASDQ